MRRTFQYVSAKTAWLSTDLQTFVFGRSGTIATNNYLRTPGNTLMSASRGYLLQYDVTVVEGALTWTTSLASGAMRFRRSGTTIGAIVMSGTSCEDDAMDLDMDSGGVLAIYLDSLNTSISHASGYLCLRRRIEA